MRINLKLVFTIAAAMLGAAVVGFTLCAMVLLGSGGAIFGFFFAVSLVSCGYGWWWHQMLLEREADTHQAVQEPPRYVLPSDVEILLDEHRQCVNTLIEVAAVTMDVEGKLRARMRQVAEHVTAVEDELEGLRVEADKVQEISRVAARTPRLTRRTSPEDYAPKKPLEELPVPDFLKKEAGEAFPGLEEALSARTGPAGATWPLPEPVR